MRGDATSWIIGQSATLNMPLYAWPSVPKINQTKKPAHHTLVALYIDRGCGA